MWHKDELIENLIAAIIIILSVFLLGVIVVAAIDTIMVGGSGLFIKSVFPFNWLGN